MNQPPYIIEEEIGAAVEATRVSLALDNLNYIFGYFNEVNQTIEQNSKVVDLAKLIYPCVILKLNFTLDHSQWGWFGFTRGLDIIIMTDTKVDYIAKQRLDINFKPTLIPIELELLKQIGKRKAFDNHWPDRMKYQSISGYFWGNEQKAVLTDTVDSKIIRGLELKVNNNPNCLVPTLIERD